MKQQREFLLLRHSLKLQHHALSRKQHVFQSLFWPLVWFFLSLVWTLAWMLEIWWNIPVFLSLPILLLGLAALIVGAVRYGWSRQTSKPSQSPHEQREAWEEASTPDVFLNRFSDPPRVSHPFGKDEEHFQVWYPEQE